MGGRIGGIRIDNSGGERGGEKGDLRAKMVLKS